MTIKRISYNDTKPFLLNIHYARRMPCVQYAFGLFDEDRLIGVVTYGQPASPSLCKGVAGENNRKNVMELNRLAILPEYNGKNCGSYLVANSLKMLPNHTFVVSYADWGGVESRWLRLSGYKLDVHRIDETENRQIFREWSFKTLCS